MKYCLRYFNKSKRLKDADEISIIYDRQDIALLTFLEEHKAQTVILMVNAVKEFDVHQEHKKLNAIHQKYPEYDIQVCFAHREAPDAALVELGGRLEIPWFVNANITTWDALHYWVERGVHQVYIAEELGFDMEAVATFCHAHDVLIRVYPNVAQASVKGADALKKFFIRPDDVSVYAPYVDVMEFWCDYEQQDVYLKIYQNERWFGPLKEIIKDFDCDIDSRRIVPAFGIMRKSCGKRCLKGRRCSICEKTYDISKALEQTNLIIKKTKHKDA